MKPTGCPRQQADSFCGCACICPAQRFSMANTRCRRLSKQDRVGDGVPALASVRFGHGRGVLTVRLLLPRILLVVYKRAILVKGFGEGPIPVNTLYTEPQAVFADPLRAAPASGSSLITTGVNRDTLLMVGWLDLSKGPQVLHVPDMGGRYYSVQLTDPSNNTNFAYVGKRVTGTEAGDYLISGPGWVASGPPWMTRISSPTNS